MKLQSVPLILSLDVSGRPTNWLPWQTAVCLYVRNQVAWTAGDAFFCFHGGYNELAKIRSEINVNSIIAIRGARPRNFDVHTPSLSNRELFRRDQQTCLYCGEHFSSSELTRDHVIPAAHGGTDVWKNVVTSCKPCNQRKGCQTPEMAKMPLLALPYSPSRIEYLILANRRILVDQMAFLKAHAPRNRRSKF